MSNRQLIIHEFYEPRRRALCTTSRPVACNACGRGLDAGYGIRAVRVDGGDAMLCDLHYPADQK